MDQSNSAEDRVKGLLEYWADWCRRGSGTNLGYPSQSVEGKMMAEGAVIRSPGRGGATVQNDELAELINGQYVLLNNDMPLWAQIIRAEYFGDGSQKFKAQKAGVGYGMYRVLLGKAVAWFVGRL